jgi:Fe-S oxidoreductase
VLESRPMNVSRELVEDLKKQIEGEVRFDRYSKILYSTDASIYQIEPLGVVILRHEGDVEAVHRLATREGIPVLSRGGGTSLAGNSFLLEELFARDGEELDFPDAPKKILVHGHCHLKALVGTEPLLGFLGRLTSDVALVDSGCCGMAGSFGYEKEHHDIFLKMEERRLLPAVRNFPNDVAVVAPGTLCRHQTADGAGWLAVHPVVLAARAARLG